MGNISLNTKEVLKDSKEKNSHIMSLQNKCKYNDSESLRRISTESQ